MVKGRVSGADSEGFPLHGSGERQGRMGPNGFHGFHWYGRRQGRIQRVYCHGTLEGRGESIGFTMVCWKAGADPEGFQGRIQRGYHGMLESRGGLHPEGLPCNGERQGWVQMVFMVWWKAGADSEGHGMLEGRSRFTMVCWKAGVDPEGSPWYAGRKAGADPEGLPWYAGRQGRIQRVPMVCWKVGVDA